MSRPHVGRLALALGLAELGGAGPRAFGLAHGLGEKPDLPVPEPFYWAACLIAIVFTFVVAALFARARTSETLYPTYDLLVHRTVRRVLAHPATLLPLRAASVFLLLLTIAAGLFGSQTIVANWTPTFVLVVWWIGTGFVQVAFGNVWRIVDPWKAIYDGLVWLGLVRPLVVPPPLRYPPVLGVWPALVLFLGVVWLELIFPEIARPRTLGWLALGYSVLALWGMFLIGPTRWLAYCDPFAVFFGYLARLSPTEVRVTTREACRVCALPCRVQPICVDCYDCFARTTQRELNLRYWGSGLLVGERFGGDRVAFVVLMLSAVTFDGLIRTIFWFDRFDIPKPFDPGLYVLARPLLVRRNTLALILFFLAFLAVYYAVSALVKGLAGTRRSVDDIACRFVVSLIPIAVVYQLAHYALYFAINSQLLIRLVSDPFGAGWNLFGTRLARLSLAVDPLVVWNFQISVIVLGHVLAVYVAHLIALRAFGRPGVAARSQIPMLVLMLAYTLAGLWLLSTPSI